MTEIERNGLHKFVEMLCCVSVCFFVVSFLLETVRERGFKKKKSQKWYLKRRAISFIYHHHAYHRHVNPPQQGGREWYNNEDGMRDKKTVVGSVKFDGDVWCF